jgi:hypothetical protein
VSPTPRSGISLKTLDMKRFLTKEDKYTLRTMMIEERDTDLVREFFEIYNGNSKVHVKMSKTY